MSSADHLVLGDWNVRCDRCSRKMKGSEAVKNWQGLYTCRRCWEPRQSQDFVRAVSEDPTPPFIRNPADVIITIVEALVYMSDSTGTSPWEEFQYVGLLSGTYIITIG